MDKKGRQANKQRGKEAKRKCNKNQKDLKEKRLLRNKGKRITLLIDELTLLMVNLMKNSQLARFRCEDITSSTANVHRNLPSVAVMHVHARILDRTLYAR